MHTETGRAPMELWTTSAARVTVPDIRVLDTLLLYEQQRRVTRGVIRLTPGGAERGIYWGPCLTTRNGEMLLLRAKYYVATDLRGHRDGYAQRRFVAEFAQKALNLSTAQDVRASDVTAVMTAIARGLRLSNVQLDVIDEAGHLPPAALDQLVTLINEVATSEQHPMTIVLVGMHDLPTNVLQLPQMARRVTEVIYLEPCDATTAFAVLRTIHDYFATVDIKSAEGREVTEFLLSPEVSDGGLIGLMVPVVEPAAVLAKYLAMPFGLRALRLAYSVRNTDAQRGRAEMERRWAAGR